MLALSVAQDGRCTSALPLSRLAAPALPQASGSFDETVIVWDVRRGSPVRKIPGHADPVSGVAFGGEPGADIIASCSFDGLT